MIDKLLEVIAQLHVPKKSTGYNYTYRSCEDIIEAAKPLLKEQGLCLTLTDDVVCVGDHNYVKALALITDGERTAQAVGFAREPMNVKQMQDSQMTGAASSYARKYALQGLLLLDESEGDIDGIPKVETITKAQITELNEIRKRLGMTKEEALDTIKNFNYSKPGDILAEDYDKVLSEFKNYQPSVKKEKTQDEKAKDMVEAHAFQRWEGKIPEDPVEREEFLDKSRKRLFVYFKDTYKMGGEEAKEYIKDALGLKDESINDMLLNPDHRQQINVLVYNDKKEVLFT